MKRRHWTADEKISILSEAEKEGVTATIRRHGFYSNTFYQWKEKYDVGGKQVEIPHQTEPPIRTKVSHPPLGMQVVVKLE